MSVRVCDQELKTRSVSVSQGCRVCVQSDSERREGLLGSVWIAASRLPCECNLKGKEDYLVPFALARSLGLSNQESITPTEHIDLNKQENKKPTLFCREDAVAEGLYSYQVDLVTEAWQKLVEYDALILEIYTSFGKTRCAAYIADRATATGKRVFVMITVSTTMRAWQEDLSKYGETFVVPRKTSSALSHATVIIPSTARFVVCMVERLARVSLVDRSTAGTLVVDEAHTFCTENRFAKLLEFRRVERVILLTATLARPNGSDRCLTLLAGGEPTTIRRSIKFKSLDETHHFNASSSSVESPVLSASSSASLSTKIAPPFTFFRRETSCLVRANRIERRGKMVVDWQHLKELLAFEESRNALLCDDIVSIFRTAVESGTVLPVILVFVWLRAHAELLVDLLSKQLSAVGENLRVDSMFGSRNSYVNCDVLVATIDKLSTGFDQASSCEKWDGRRFDIVMLFGSTRSATKLLQMIGRGARAKSNDFVVIGYADSDSVSVSHANITAKLIRKEGVEPRVVKSGSKMMLPSRAQATTACLAPGAVEMCLTCSKTFPFWVGRNGLRVIDDDVDKEERTNSSVLPSSLICDDHIYESNKRKLFDTAIDTLGAPAKNKKLKK